MMYLFFVLVILIVFIPNTVHATEFLYDSTLDPESIEAKQQMENYCSLTDRPYVPPQDRFYYNNSTHFISSKSCTWEEIPKCGEGTVYRDGVCNVIDLDDPRFSGSDCLIATASYGTPMAKEVQLLREIRDLQLLQTESGSAFMNSFNTFYYSFAPTVAQLEYDNPVFKEIIKTAITPLVASLSLLQFVEMDSELEVLGYGSGMIMLNIGMYFVVPIVAVWQIKKRIYRI